MRNAGGDLHKTFNPLSAIAIAGALLAGSAAPGAAMEPFAPVQNVPSVIERAGNVCGASRDIGRNGVCHSEGWFAWRGIPSGQGGYGWRRRYGGQGYGWRGGYGGPGYWGGGYGWGGGYDGQAYGWRGG